MRQHPLLQNAAVIARVFRIDPVLVLAETDPIRQAARIAATQHIVELENAQNRR